MALHIGLIGKWGSISPHTVLFYENKIFDTIGTLCFDVQGTFNPADILCGWTRPRSGLSSYCFPSHRQPGSLCNQLNPAHPKFILLCLRLLLGSSAVPCLASLPVKHLSQAGCALQRKAVHLRREEGHWPCCTPVLETQRSNSSVRIRKAIFKQLQSIIHVTVQEC